VAVNNSSSSAPAYTPPDIKMGEAIPPEFRDKPFFKDKTFVEVIKEHVNLQTLLGQRPTGIPKDDASDEEWGKFVSTLKPKSLDEYVLPETEFSKANKRTPGYEKAVKEIMADAGVPKRQFPKVVEGIEKFLSQAQVNQTGQTKAQEAEFEKLLDTTYGANKQIVIDRAKKLMGDSVDPTLQPKVAEVLKNISNDQLFVLTAVLEGIHKKYIAEDNFSGGGGNTGGDAVTWQTEAETIMKSEAYKDFRNPAYDFSHQKVQELFQKIAATKINKK